MKRVGCTGAIVLFFVAAVVVTFFIEGGGDRPGGAKDASSEGHLALLLLLKELGFEPAVHSGSPKELAESEIGILILPAIPEGEEGVGSFAPSWYGDYVQRGGDLILPVSRWEELHFLRESVDLSDPDIDVDFGSYHHRFDVVVPGSETHHMVSDPQRLLDVTTIRSGRERVELWRAEPTLEGFGAKDEFGDDEDAVFAAIVRHGLGRVVVVAVPSAFQNQLLPVLDNGLVFVRLIEHLQAGKPSPRVPTFDQYVIVGAKQTSWVGALFRPPLLPATLAVLLVLLAWAWSVSARRSFPLDRRLARRPPPAERARALAGLMSRARHPEWLEPRADPQPTTPEHADSQPGDRAVPASTPGTESDE